MRLVALGNKQIVGEVANSASRRLGESITLPIAFYYGISRGLRDGSTGGAVA
jgi:hypothetical protein